MSQFSENQQNLNSINIDTKPLLDILTSLNEKDPSSTEYEETIFNCLEKFVQIYSPCIKNNKNPSDLVEFKSIVSTIFTSFHKVLISSVEDANKEGDILTGKDLEDFILLKTSIEYIINNISNLNSLVENTDLEFRKSLDYILNYFDERAQIQIDIGNQMKEMNDKLEQLANSLEKYVENSK